MLPTEPELPVASVCLEPVAVTARDHRVRYQIGELGANAKISLGGRQCLCLIPDDENTQTRI